MKTKYIINKKVSALVAASCAAVMLSGCVGLQAASASTLVDEGVWTTTPWSLRRDGTLTLGVNHDHKAGGSYKLDVLRGMPSDLRPGGSHNADVRRIRIAPRTTVILNGRDTAGTADAPVNPALACNISKSAKSDIGGAFAGFPQLKSVNLTGAQSEWGIRYNSFENLFCQDPALTNVKIPSGMIDHWVNSIAGMFSHDSSLTRLDLTKISTAGITDFSDLFLADEKLNCIRGIKDLDVHNGQDFSDMFNGATQVRRMDLSGWKVDHAVSYRRMFYGMTELEKLDISNLGTPFDITSFDSELAMLGATPNLEVLGLGGNFEFNPNSMPLDGAVPGQNGPYGHAPVFDKDGKVHMDTQRPVNHGGIHRYYTGLWQQVGNGSLKKPQGRVATISELLNMPASQLKGTWVWQPQPVKYDSQKIPTTGTVTLTNKLGFQGDGVHGVSWNGISSTVQAGQHLTVNPVAPNCTLNLLNPDCTGVLAIRKTKVNDEFNNYDWEGNQVTGIAASLANPAKPADDQGDVKLKVTTNNAAPGLYTVFTNYKTNLPDRSGKNPGDYDPKFESSHLHKNLRVDSYVYVQAPPTADTDGYASLHPGQSVVVNSHPKADPMINLPRTDWGAFGINSLQHHLSPASIVSVDYPDFTPFGIFISQATSWPADGVKITVSKAVHRENYKIPLIYKDDLGQVAHALVLLNVL